MVSLYSSNSPPLSFEIRACIESCSDDPCPYSSNQYCNGYGACINNTCVCDANSLKNWRSSCALETVLVAIYTAISISTSVFLITSFFVITFIARKYCSTEPLEKELCLVW